MQQVCRHGERRVGLTPAIPYSTMSASWAGWLASAQLKAKWPEEGGKQYRIPSLSSLLGICLYCDFLWPSPPNVSLHLALHFSFKSRMRFKWNLPMWSNFRSQPSRHCHYADDICCSWVSTEFSHKLDWNKRQFSSSTAWSCLVNKIKWQNTPLYLINNEREMGGTSWIHQVIMNLEVWKVFLWSVTATLPVTLLPSCVWTSRELIFPTLWWSCKLHLMTIRVMLKLSI